MFLELQNRGCEAWYDMMTDDLTTGGMIAGIRESPVFLLFLTAGALERPFVQLELRTARREQREVLLVHEEDARHGKFDFGELRAAPPDLAGVGASHESMPYRRRKHEKRGFYDELLRRIAAALAAHVAAGRKEALPPAEPGISAGADITAGIGQ